MLVDGGRLYCEVARSGELRDGELRPEPVDAKRASRSVCISVFDTLRQSILTYVHCQTCRF